MEMKTPLQRCQIFPQIYVNLKRQVPSVFWQLA